MIHPSPHADSTIAGDESPIARSPLRRLDPVAVSAAARIETRNREVHLPPVSAYRWWARRTESINGAILKAVMADRPGRLLVADPFCGGGVIPLAAVIRHQRTYAQDLNPWATSGLVGMLSLATVPDLRAAAAQLAALARPLLSKAYDTTFSDGGPAVLSHTFRVATAACPVCDVRHRLFPHALVSLKVRRERKKEEAFMACPRGDLFDGIENRPQACPVCGETTRSDDEYTRNRLATCPDCGHQAKLEDLAAKGHWRWEVVLVERVQGRKRQLAQPTSAEIAQAAEAAWEPSVQLGSIPAGQETGVLRRHGFFRWEDIYPGRQRVIVERLLSLAGEVSDNRAVIRALRLAIIGSTEMAGLLSRWDRYYLKSYEAMAGHRFNFTSFPVEPNVWGTAAAGRGSVSRRLASFDKAAAWLRERADGLRVEGPLSATERRRSVLPAAVDVRVVEGSSERMLLPDRSVDLVLTDPPYHDDVQYDELSLPLRAWAKQSLDRLQGEAVVNAATGNNAGLDEYRALLTRIFRETHRALKQDGHLIFSYANRVPQAWSAVHGALQDAGFRAVGYAVLHSENETDVAKRNVRACTMDLLMDLVPSEWPAVETWTPDGLPANHEGSFLRLVGATFMRVGELDRADFKAFEKELLASSFLA